MARLYKMILQFRFLQQINVAYFTINISYIVADTNKIHSLGQVLNVDCYIFAYIAEAFDWLPHDIYDLNVCCLFQTLIVIWILSVRDTSLLILFCFTICWLLAYAGNQPRITLGQAARIARRSNGKCPCTRRLNRSRAPTRSLNRSRGSMCSLK